ncbi:nicotinate (nicotinamide) nucleotide adenylyltransferase [Flavobacteriales bacterium]|jgi:nicotinate-nucleotide adenylyltransferase|nr:nicotinate (nicotinamide) nucleotide adenylyltransferase [Flavobacteriales bacterium]MDG1174716.1 nicotinate (nicotinamide) nucleotide adenylyltransferase [Flavobacteriales bacterium]
MKKVGLFFGSFNPIHVGHLVIANHIAHSGMVDEVWFVVSPQNPFKKKKSLLEEYHRLALVNEAIDENPKLKSSDIEFTMPQPSYTADTLAFLIDKYPELDFSLIMGEDNIKSFHKWKNYEVILKNHSVLVYPRVGVDEDLKAKSDILNHKSVHVLENIPVMDISASYIRNQIKEGKTVAYLLTDKVAKYLDEMNFYK